MSIKRFHELTANFFVSADVQEISIAKGENLYTQGTTQEYIFMLLKGELNIMQKKQVLWQAQEQEYIGITSFFSEEKEYSASVKACKDSDVIAIPISDFRDALINSPELNQSLMNLFCDRIDLTFEKVKARTKLSRKKRLVNLLIRKSEQMIPENKIIVPYSLIDISEQVNISYNFVKHFLEELQTKKLIKLRKEKVEITDLNGLKLVSQMKGLMSIKE
jgi:CRP-like cAMP-binding protein